MNNHEFTPQPSVDLRDPSVSPAVLAQLAQYQPDLWREIRSHPNCYPGLAEWLDAKLAVPAPPQQAQQQPAVHQQPIVQQHQQPAVQQQADPVPTQPAVAPAPKLSTDEWSSQFQQQNGREPTLSEYHAALAGGQVRQPQDASVQQMAEGAKQLASGAKDFLTHRVAPAAVAAAQNARQVASNSSVAKSGLVVGVRLPASVMVVTSVLGIISLMLPVATLFGYSFSYLQEDLASEGRALLVVLLINAAAAAASIFVPKKPMIITAGVVGLLVGVMGMLDGFGTMANLSKEGISPGIGLVLLALTSTVIVGTAIFMFLGLRRKPLPVAPVPAPPQPDSFQG